MTTIRRFLLIVGAPIFAGALLRHAPPAVPRAVANDNRKPGGRMERDTLVLRLTVTPAVWHILGDREPPFNLLAFAEEGKPPTIPGPLIRVRVGTPVRVLLRNPVNDTLIVRGLSERAAAQDSLIVLPGDTARVSFLPSGPGTYLYWAVSTKSGPALSLAPGSRIFDSQLAGAIVVDPPGTIPGDRIFLISMAADREFSLAAEGSRDRHGTPVRQFSAINGKSWPETERLRYQLGDSIRWRVVNYSPESHPMHLHGSYFRVESHGTPQTAADSIYTSEQRRTVVTETIGPKQTMSIVWSPDRPGGWLFHCHLTNHVAKMPRIGRREEVEFPSMHHQADPDRHTFAGMNGLILGITVTGRLPVANEWRPARRLRLFVQSDSAPGDRERRFGYVLQQGAAPRQDSVAFPGQVLVLTRGEPTSIEIVNRSGESTTIHWHGLEVESYYDGVAGWSGTPNRITPAIRPGKSFEVRITPRRAGTFMYHTHFDEMRQQYGGLAGALLVLEPGEQWEPERDLVFLLSDGVPQRLFVNGSLTPPTQELVVGKTYRLRIADIAVYRLSVPVRLLRDSSLVSWRPVAKDGITLTPSQATLRPSIANVPPGETADFEFTPDQPGDLVLVVGAPIRPPEATVRFRVTGR